MPEVLPHTAAHYITAVGDLREHSRCWDISNSQTLIAAGFQQKQQTREGRGRLTAVNKGTIGRQTAVMAQKTIRGARSLFPPANLRITDYRL